MAIPTVKPVPKPLVAKPIEPTEVKPESAVAEIIPPVTPSIMAKKTGFNINDFKQKFLEKQVRKPKPLFMLITGRRAAGKSTITGTCPGDLLLIYSRQEHHSYQAATSLSNELGNPHAIIPMCFDQTEDGTPIDAPEKVWNFLSDRLKSLAATPNIAEIVPYIALDSLNSLERYTIKRDNVLKATQFAKSQESTANLMELVLELLLPLHEKGVNILVTMSSEMKERPDGTLALTPYLTGYRAADEVIGSFPDIAVVNCIQMEKEEGGVEDKFVLQFRNAEGVKSGKRFSGEAVTTTFSPRLQSLPRHQLPEYLEANITTLQSFIADTFNSLGKAK